MSVADRNLSRTFRSLEYPNFRRFAIGQAISQTGTWMQSVAVGILVLRLTDSGVALGLTTVAQFGPLLLLGPWAGLLSDRVDQHHLLLWVNVGGAAVALAFAAVVLPGDPPLWSIYLLATAAGVVQALENPVRRVFVTQLVDEHLITNAIALNSTVMISAEAAGLALAGVLIGWPGITACFAVNAVSFVPQLWLFARMDRGAMTFQPRTRRAKGQTRAGFEHAWQTPRLRLTMLLLAAVGMFGFTAHTVALPLLAVRDLNGSSRTYTVLLTAVSVGSLAGALVCARRNAPDTTALARAAIAFGMLNAVLAAAPTTPIAVVLAIPVGYAIMITVGGLNSSVQLMTPPQLRGRVMSLVSMVLIGSSPIGGLLIGWTAEWAGARVALAAAGAVSVVAGVVVLRHLPHSTWFARTGVIEHERL